jgi:hypothetical protein
MHKTNGSKENQLWLIALKMALDFNTDFTQTFSGLRGFIASFIKSTPLILFYG